MAKGLPKLPKLQTYRAPAVKAPRIPAAEKLDDKLTPPPASGQFNSGWEVWMDSFLKARNPFWQAQVTLGEAGGAGSTRAD